MMNRLSAKRILSTASVMVLNGDTTAYEDAIKLAIEALSQPPVDVPDTNVGEWIPCSERLPDAMQKVLVTLGTTTGKRFVRTDHIMNGSWWQWNSDCVIAWMPLPEPYKGVE